MRYGHCGKRRGLRAGLGRLGKDQSQGPARSFDASGNFRCDQDCDCACANHDGGNGPSDRKEKKAKVRRPTPPMPRKGLAGPLTNMDTGLGMTVSMIDKQCGMAIVESAEDCAQAWEDLAKTNPKVRRALLMLLETSDVTKIVIAHAPIMMAVMVHHMPLVREQQMRLIEVFANTGGNDEEEGEE